MNSRRTFSTEEDVTKYFLAEEDSKLPRDQAFWNQTKVTAFRSQLEIEKEEADTDFLKALWDSLIQLVQLPYVYNAENESDNFDSPIKTAIEFLEIEIPMEFLLNINTAPNGSLKFFRCARRALHVFGGPKIQGHPVEQLACLLYQHSATWSEIQKSVNFLKAEIKIAFQDLQGPRAASPRVTSSLAHHESTVRHGGFEQGHATINEGEAFQYSPTAANLPETQRFPSDVPVYPPGPLRSRGNSSATSPPVYTQEQLNYAKELQGMRTPSTNTRQADSKSPRESAGHSTPATSAPSVDDDEFFWYPEMTEQQRQSGMRSIQNEFKIPTRFSNNRSNPESLVMIQDVHLKFKRLLKASRFTESAAREMVPYLYHGAAARKYDSIRKRHPQANTEQLLARMESTYINGVTQRQASTEIRKIRLNPTAQSTRAAVDNLIYRLQNESINCSMEDQTDAALVNLLCHCVQNVTWAKPLRQALIAKNISDFDSACDVLSALATDEDISMGNNFEVGINFGSVNSSRPYNDRRSFNNRPPPYDNRRVGTLRSAVQAYGKTRHNPIDRKTGKPMVCRSQNCDSTEHFQYSGHCPIEKARRHAGTSAIFMASSMEADLERGEDIVGILCEILFSKADDQISAAHHPEDDNQMVMPTMPDSEDSSLLYAPPPAETAFVNTDLMLADLSEYKDVPGDTAFVNFATVEDVQTMPMIKQEIRSDTENLNKTVVETPSFRGGRV